MSKSRVLAWTRFPDSATLQVFEICHRLLNHEGTFGCLTLHKLLAVNCPLTLAGPRALVVTWQIPLDSWTSQDLQV